MSSDMFSTAVSLLQSIGSQIEVVVTFTISLAFEKSEYKKTFHNRGCPTDNDLLCKCYEC